RLRGREVREALGQVDAAVLLAEPGHLPDHGLGEARAALGDGVAHEGCDCTVRRARAQRGCRAVRPLTAPGRSPTLCAMDAQRVIARRMVIGLPPAGIDAAWERDFTAFPPAGVILFRRDFRDLAALRARTQRLP